MEWQFVFIFGAIIHLQGPGLFEPIHGSAPVIAGQVEFMMVQFLFPLQIIFFISLVYVVFMEHMQDKANPLATILSYASDVWLRGSQSCTENQEFCTGDIYSKGNNLVGCQEMGREVVESVELKISVPI